MKNESRSRWFFCKKSVRGLEAVWKKMFIKVKEHLESLVNGAVHLDQAGNEGVADAVTGGGELIGDSRILPTRDTFENHASGIN